MKLVLIHKIGEGSSRQVAISSFVSEKVMLEFISDENIGHDIIQCYEVVRSIEIEPYEKVTEYRIKK